MVKEHMNPDEGKPVSEGASQEAELEATLQFFSRPSSDVAADLASYALSDSNDILKTPENTGRVMRVYTPEGWKSYRITSVQAYSEAQPNKIWQGSRADFIRTMKPGETITYAYRAGVLTFIKTQGADNVELKQVLDVEENKKSNGPTHVSKLLGLGHGDRGFLSLEEDGSLSFHRPDALYPLSTINQEQTPLPPLTESTELSFSSDSSINLD